MFLVIFTSFSETNSSSEEEESFIKPQLQKDTHTQQQHNKDTNEWSCSPGDHCVQFDRSAGEGSRIQPG